MTEPGPLVGDVQAKRDYGPVPTFIEWSMRVSGSPIDGTPGQGPTRTDPIYESHGRLAMWDWTDPHEALALIVSQIARQENVSFDHGIDLPTLTPNDTELTVTMRYVDNPERAAWRSEKEQ